VSVFASAWAWRQPVSGNAKLVLLALADECRGTDGLCWPGLKRVSDMVGVDVRSVRRHIEALEKARLIVREERSRDDGSQTSNLIRLCLPAEMPPPPDAAVRGGPDSAVRPRAVEERTGSSEKGKKILALAEEPSGFVDWLGHHVTVAGQLNLSLSVPKHGTSYRSSLARTFAALVIEGYSLEDFKLASEGVLSDDYMRLNGHVKPENVLRKEKIGGRIQNGRLWREQRATGAGAKYSHLDGG
jgi:hypothetical protein